MGSMRSVTTIAGAWAITTVFLMVFSVAVCSTMARADSKPNLIVILADDLGWADTTLYGKTSLYETPNIQRLAARGMTFTNAYAAAPICSPTRASIVTGQTPARLGFTAPSGHVPEVRLDAEVHTTGSPHQKSTNVKSATRFERSLPTLPRLIKQAGYATAHFGKWHLGREPYSPLEFGFDVDIPHWYGPGPKTNYLAPWGYENFKEGAPGDHIEDRMAEEAVAWLKRRDRSKPFFLNYWQFSVHAPFGAKQELIDRYREKLGNPKRKQGTPPAENDQLESLAHASGYQSDVTGQQSPTRALRGEEMDRGPMFTLVPGHGNTPDWLPPAMSVHDGDWKLIRIFHYGEDGKHDYRLYNLRDDIGETKNLAAEHPEKVKALDRLIEDYIAAAEVVVPLPNPNFDPANFDPSTIGVQKGGLKMK